jgi:hypothetical protein
VSKKAKTTAPDDTDELETDAPADPAEAADAADFEAVLRQQCEDRAKGHGEGSGGARRILKILDMPESRRRTRILHRLKEHARVHLVAAGAMTATDKFGAVDWNKFFTGLIQLLTTILPLILQFIK